MVESANWPCFLPEMAVEAFAVALLVAVNIVGFDDEDVICFITDEVFIGFTPEEATDEV